MRGLTDGPPLCGDYVVVADRTGVILEGKYRLVRRLGEGGMGVVYEAHHSIIDRRCAVKLIHPEIAKNPEIVTRFLREAKAAAAIHHPGVIGIYDVGVARDGAPYLVMEYLEGHSLGAHITECGRLPAAEAVGIVVQALGAVGAAHRAGIVHRDLKPDNLFLLPDVPGSPVVRVLDFGISKMSSTENHLEKVTRTGCVLGTPHYMAPEQASGRPDIDHRLDIYAFGVILFECVTGRLPFPGDNYNQVLTRIITEEFPRPSLLDPLIHPKLDEVILKATAHKKEDRYQSAEEMAAALLPLTAPDVRDRLDRAGLRHPVPMKAPAGDAQPAEDLAPSLAGRLSEHSSTARRRPFGPVPVIFGAAALLALSTVVLVWRPWEDPNMITLPGLPVEASGPSASTAPNTSTPSPPAAEIVAAQGGLDQQTLAELERMRAELTALRTRLDTAEQAGQQEEAQTIKAQIEAAERAQDALAAPVATPSSRVPSRGPSASLPRTTNTRRTQLLPDVLSGSLDGEGATPPAPSAGPAAGPVVAPLPAVSTTGSWNAAELPPEYASAAAAPPPSLPEVPPAGVVRQIFGSVRGSVAECLGPNPGAVATQATIRGSTGEVTGVRVSGALPEADACIAPIVRGLRFPQFTRPTLVVDYRYTF